MTAFVSGGSGAWRRLLCSPWLHVLLAGAWLGMMNGVRPLTLPDEGRYAGVAWDMLRSGQHSVPLLDGMPYFHKPPLYYWLAEIGMSWFGPTEWAARLPSWLAAWAAACGTYAFVRARRGARQAQVCLAVLVTLPLYYGGAQFANMDMLVAALIALCIAAAGETVLRRARGRPWHAFALAAAVLAALAVLAKGLIGVVLPGCVLALWLAVRRDAKGLRALLWPPALVGFAVVALPWFALMQSRYPDFFHYFFIYQQFERFAQSGFNNAQPFWFYVPVLAGLCLPWALWSAGVFGGRFWREDSDGVRALMAIWVVVVVVFFSLPRSKLVGYVMPALPPVAVLLSEAVCQALRGARKNAGPARLAALSLGLAALSCLVAAPLAALRPRDSARAAAAAIRPLLQPEDVVLTLHRYPFDLAFYLRWPRPFWVVDDWTRPDLAWRDNWRKELYDASAFAPERGREMLVSEALVSEAAWLARVCAGPPDQRYWAWGAAGDEDRYPLLRGRAQQFDGPHHRVWMLRADDALTRQACAGTPTAARPGT